MKALFIGGTGTISTDVVALAQQRGWEITLLNRGSKKMPEGIHSIIADINDEEAVAKAIALEHYDVVAQFIGYTAEDVKRDIRLFQNKTRQYIFISSASAYQKPLTDYRITESTPLVNPYWQYSRNKIEAEEVLMSAYRTSGFPVTIVRPSHTYNGTKPPVAVHGDKGNWQILKRILDGKPVIGMPPLYSAGSKMLWSRLACAPMLLYSSIRYPLAHSSSAGSAPYSAVLPSTFM